MTRRRKSRSMEVLATLPKWPEAKAVIHIARETGLNQTQVSKTIRGLKRKHCLIQSEMRKVFKSTPVRVHGIAAMDWDCTRNTIQEYFEERQQDAEKD